LDIVQRHVQQFSQFINQSINRTQSSSSLSNKIGFRFVFYFYEFFESSSAAISGKFATSFQCRWLKVGVNAVACNIHPSRNFSASELFGQNFFCSPCKLPTAKAMLILHIATFDVDLPLDCLSQLGFQTHYNSYGCTNVNSQLPDELTTPPHCNGKTSLLFSEMV